MEYIVKRTENPDELYHYGVKGMKWGRQRYQNKDGSVRSLAKNLADNNLSSYKKIKKLDQKLDKKYEKLYKKYGAKDSNGVVSKIGNNKTKQNRYLEESDSIYRKYARKAQKLEKKLSNERDKTIKKVFLNKEIKPEIDNAKKIKQEMKKSEESILGVNSENYKKAYKEYAKKVGDSEESRYGFDHYEWRKGGSSYDSAYKEYETKNKKLMDNYNKTVSSIGKKIYGEFSNNKLSNGLDMTYSDFGRVTTEQLINSERY